ncbi:MAG: type-F conjugative transfer system pilin assembly protein TrbC [Rhodospirillales bacterium]|nr:type-F conjugative transfer system pilin assembly protein TrbC [Rhodospirillales bacterium]MDE0378142.1 type-F conjugative transfer system pilin assembly protein TrbC [Rhodospirillales bacterium]
MTPLRNGLVVMFLAVSLMAAGSASPVGADGTGQAGPETDAARLVEDVLRRAGADDGESLGAWTRSILDRVMERAGGTARQTVPGPSGGTAAPLPAERHAGELTGPRSGTAEVLIFTSLSVPAASWRQWARDAARLGAAEYTGPPLVLRGVGEGGLPGTAKRIGERLGGAKAGVAIDPRLFRLFGIERVPAVVVVPGGVPPCRSRGCTADPAPAHDRIAGNIGLIAALEAVADEGAVGRGVARRHLERLRREGQP